MVPEQVKVFRNTPWKENVVVGFFFFLQILGMQLWFSILEHLWS